MNIQFSPGQFVALKAITKIHLGAIGVDIMPGNVIEYDGSSTRIGGVLHNISSIGGAIKVGWLVPLEDNVSQYIPQPAGVQVRPATSASQERGAAMVIERAVDDERQVGSLSESNARRAEATANQFRVNQVPQSQVQHAPVAQQGYNPQLDAARLQFEEAQRQYQAAINAASGQAQVQAPRPQYQVDAAPAEPKKYQIIHEDPPVEIHYPLGNTGAAQAPALDARHLRVDDSYNDGARPVAQLRPAKMPSIDVSDAGKLRTELSALDPVYGTGAKVQKVASAPMAPPPPPYNPPIRANAEALQGTPITQTHPNGATGDVAVATAGDDLEDLLKDAFSVGRPAAGPRPSGQ